MEIKISKCNKTCAASERDFQHEDEVVSLVRLSEGVLQREDYLKEFWQEEFGAQAYSVWSHQFYDPKVDDAPEEEASPLRTAFYAALEADTRLDSAVAFLAAQLLRRQKVFRMVKEVEEAEDGVRLALYTDRVGNRLIEVRDASFTYPELDEARSALMERLAALEAEQNEQEQQEGEALSDVAQSEEATQANEPEVTSVGG